MDKKTLKTNILKCIRILFPGSELIPFMFFGYFLVMLANVASIYKKSHRKIRRTTGLSARKSYGADHLKEDHRACVDNQGIRPSLHGLMEGRSLFTNLISFCDQAAHLVNEGKAVNVFYLKLHQSL